MAASESPSTPASQLRPRWMMVLAAVGLALIYLLVVVTVTVRVGEPKDVLYLPVLPVVLILLLGALAKFTAWFRVSEVVCAAMLLLVAHGAGSTQISSRWLTSMLARPLMAEGTTSAAHVEAIPPALSIAVPAPSAFGVEPAPERQLIDGLRSGNNALFASASSASTAMHMQSTSSGLPWRSLLAPFLGTLPLIVGFLVITVALAAVTARQWNQHERLQQPLAQITGAFCEGSIWLSRPFWIALCATMGVALWNIAADRNWHPLPGIRLSLTVPELPGLLGMTQSGFAKTIMEGPWSTIEVNPLIIAVTFLLSAEMGFSLWGGFWLAVLVAGWLTSAGIPFDFDRQGRDMGNGAMFAMAVVIVWLGRHHYWSLCKGALGFANTGDDRTGVWGLRILILASVAMAGLIGYHASSWQAGVLGFLLPTAMSLVLMRITAEAGLVAFQVPNQMAVTLNTLGLPLAMPVQALFMLQWLMISTMTDTRTAVAGHLGHVSGLADRQHLSGRWWVLIALVAIAAVVLGLIAYIIVAWVSPSTGFKLDASQFRLGDLRQANSGSWSTVASSLAWGPVMWGALMVGAVVGLRRLWNGCPLNPLALCVAFSFPIYALWSSIMLGWLAKVACVRYGGSALFTSLKPIAFGIIAGELFGRFLDYAATCGIALSK